MYPSARQNINGMEGQWQAPLTLNKSSPLKNSPCPRWLSGKPSRGCSLGVFTKEGFLEMVRVVDGEGKNRKRVT